MRGVGADLPPPGLNGVKALLALKAVKAIYGACQLHR